MADNDLLSAISGLSDAQADPKGVKPTVVNLGKGGSFTVRDAGQHRITRDAFLFLTPKSEKQKEDFAQCGPCRMFVPESYLEGKLVGDRCIIHGSKQVVHEYMSCGFMCAWPTPDGRPVEEVIKAHAKELLKPGGLPGSVTAKESGLVDRLVQCIRCRFETLKATICGLYAKLNKQFPDIFDLDEKITPNSCCNAQEPKTK